MSELSEMCQRGQRQTRPENGWVSHDCLIFHTVGQTVYLYDNMITRLILVSAKGHSVACNEIFLGSWYYLIDDLQYENAVPEKI